MNSSPRSKIEALLTEARLVVPTVVPPIDGFRDTLQWHQFEHALWSIGEQIRHAINRQPRLRSDHALYAEFLSVVQNRHGMRGRQSFVLLFAYRPCLAWARDLASLIPDSDIDGHIISALYKMRASGFSRVVAPFMSSDATWIRKEARRYLSFDLDAPIPHERSA
ncbi:MAG TPA: hypothetical protein VMD27_02890 [Candidatus Aquilonibacter sp.]|nr:hypothetical protein [Candidatus Aquilonibacter sp.]